LLGYEVAFVIAPDIGQVTLAVDSSPTAPDRGCHSETNALKLYCGLVAVVDPDTGFITIATDVPIVG
jgi:hypothetical protein